MSTLGDRFWSKVEKTEDCWVWIAARSAQGYGSFRSATGTKNAHRLAFEDARGAVPQGLVLDHLCRNRACVKPAHMEAVTQGVNVLRGDSPIAQQARRTACPQGHPYTPENCIPNTQGRRRCRVCRNAYLRRLRAQKRAAA